MPKGGAPFPTPFTEELQGAPDVELLERFPEFWRPKLPPEYLLRNYLISLLEHLLWYRCTFFF